MDSIIDNRQARLFARAIVLLGIASFLLCSHGCGGGGGGSTVVAGGIGGTGSALGAVSAKGSITVNGVKYDTANADVFIEGAQQPTKGDLTNIQLGMTVLVRGVYDSQTTGHAQQVIYLNNLLGPVTAINPVNNSFSAMGQTVLIDTDPNIGTRFSGINALADLLTNDLVEVSGSPDGHGTIVASFVAKKGSFVNNGLTTVELKGTPSNADFNTRTFNIAGFTVVFSGNTVFKNMTTGDLLTSPFVEARGTTLDANGALLAASVERIDRPVNPGRDHRLEVTGLVTDCTPVCSTFSVEGQAIVTNAQTVFKNGTAENLSNERKIEVKGVINSNGVLVASEISFVKGSVRIEANADGAADLAKQTFAVLGITVKVNSVTDLKGLSLASIATGDALKVLGYRIGDKAIIANRVERASPGSGKVVLQGPLAGSDKTTASFTIIGVPVAADRQTGFRDRNDGVISFDTFFDTTPLNSIVKTKGLERLPDQIDATSSEGEVKVED